VIVLDASALVELLLHTPTGEAIATRIADPSIGLHVPHLADVEVAQTLRQFVSDGDLDSVVAVAAIDDLRTLDLQRHAHEPLLDRVWALRHNLTAYDAVYWALAEVLDTVVLTCDGRLSRAPGASRRIELVTPPMPRPPTPTPSAKRPPTRADVNPPRTLQGRPRGERHGERAGR
jgi:predicted nucleic acid-binding protein